MEFLRKRLISFLTITAIATVLSVVAVGQKKVNFGYVFGQVTIGLADGDNGEALRHAKVELESSGERITIIADEGGGFDERLRTGKYQLVAVRNADGKLLMIFHGQTLFFQVKKNQMTRLDIDVVKP